MDSTDLQVVAAQLKVLGHPHRLRIFVRLTECCQFDNACTAPAEQSVVPCVGDLGAEMGLPGSTLSHHLKELERVGLIQRARDSTTIRCHVVEKAVADLAKFFDGIATGAD